MSHKRRLCIVTIIALSLLGHAAHAAIRLDLDAMAVIGNQELPRVVYIVAWQSAPKGDVLQQTLESLHTKEITPIDRDVSRRQVEYYDLLNKD